MTVPVVEEEWPEFVELKRLAVELSFEWTLHRELYGDGKHVAKMNRSAPEFFSRINRTIVLNVTRHLAAMLDPKRTGKSSNLTIRLLLDQGTQWLSMAQATELTAIVEDLESKAGKLRRYRNKELVHYDSGVLLGSSNKTRVTFGEIGDVIERLYEALNFIQSRLFESNTAFEQPIQRAPGDILAAIGDSLWLQYLQHLIKNEEITPTELKEIIRWGRHGHGWWHWGVARGDDPTSWEPEPAVKDKT